MFETRPIFIKHKAQKTIRSYCLISLLRYFCLKHFKNPALFTDTKINFRDASCISSLPISHLPFRARSPVSSFSHTHMGYFQTNFLCLFLSYTLHFMETPLNIWKHTALLLFKAFSEIQLTNMPLQPLWAKCVISSYIHITCFQMSK